eukprot:jgi/Undpi1/2612/HiC_scaffold_13.g05991.m1
MWCLLFPFTNLSRNRQDVLGNSSRQPSTTTTTMRAGLSTWRGGQGPDQRRGWRNNHSLLSISPRREEVDLEGQREAERASDGAGTAAVAAGVAVEGGAKPVSTGIGWVTILSVFLTQVSFVGFLFRLSTPAIRQKLCSSLMLTPSGAALGLAGAVPLLAFGFAMDRMDWDWVKKVDEITRGVTVQLFGTKRQASKVLAIVIPLATLIGFAEEFTFRGYLPLLLAAKTGLPSAAVIGLSGVIFGALHAATWAYFINATLSGLFFHYLLLSSGNICVPILAHAFYDAYALMRYHLKAHKRNSYAQLVRDRCPSPSAATTLAALAVENFGCLGKEGSDLIDQAAASIVGGTGGSSLSQKGVCKERLVHIIFVTTQVANSSRVHRCRLALRNHQAARVREGEAGRLQPMTSGLNVDED